MDEVVANIRSALISTKGPSNLQQLQKDYREIVGQLIPFKKFGFSSLETFLKSIPSLKVSNMPNGEIIVDAVATDNVKHIVSLVNKQKASKKKVGYATSRFRTSNYTSKSPGYSNKSPSYANRSIGYSSRRQRFEAPRYKPSYPKETDQTPSYSNKPRVSKSKFDQPRFRKETNIAIPKPVGNQRRLSVFERLGPRVEVSDEENFSTYDEEEDEAVSSLLLTRQVTRIPNNPRKLSLPANIRIKTTSRVLKKSPPGATGKTFNSPNLSPSSSSGSELPTWTDAATVFQREDELNNRMSRMSLREKSTAREASRLSMPIFNNNAIPPDMICGNSSNISDMGRPRMRMQPFGLPASISGTTRPRPAFVPPSNIRPNVPRFNQNKFISNLPWPQENNPVVVVETTVDHRIQKEEDLKKSDSEEDDCFFNSKSKIARSLERLILAGDLTDIEEEKPLNLGPIEKPASPVYKIDMIKRWSDIASYLGHSTDEESNILDVKIPENFNMDSTKPKIPKWSDIPKLNSFLDVKVSHVCDPYCFYIQPIKSSPILNALMGKIQQKYSENSSPCDIENICPDEYYAMKYEDNFWYRVKVAHFISPDHVTVFFCDFGYEIEVPVTELVTLEPEFYEVPFQAIQAKIDGIRPNQATWITAESRYFSDRVLKKHFVSLVASVENRRELVLGLKLYDTIGKDDINIGREMIDNYFAQYDLDV